MHGMFLLDPQMTPERPEGPSQDPLPWQPLPQTHRAVNVARSTCHMSPWVLPPGSLVCMTEVMAEYWAPGSGPLMSVFVWFEWPQRKGRREREGGEGGVGPWEKERHTDRKTQICGILEQTCKTLILAFLFVQNLVSIEVHRTRQRTHSLQRNLKIIFKIKEPTNIALYLWAGLSSYSKPTSACSVVNTIQTKYYLKYLTSFLT